MRNFRAPVQFFPSVFIAKIRKIANMLSITFLLAPAPFPNLALQLTFILCVEYSLRWFIPSFVLTGFHKIWGAALG